MVLVDDSDAVMIGNKVETVVPYTMNDEFTVPAKLDGRVIEKEKDYMVVQYTDGSYKTIILKPEMEKNAAAGFYIVNQLTTDLSKGSSFVANQILAWNPKAFTKFKDQKHASMNLGPLIKIAVMNGWEVYEDSAPLSEGASERMATVISNEKQIILDKNTTVDQIVSIGQRVKTGDMLIKFDESTNDGDDSGLIGDKLINEVRGALGEAIIEASGTTVHSKYDGVVSDIRIDCTVPVNQLSPSLQVIVKEYHDRVDKINKVMTKYANSGDSKYYKSGNVIRESSDIVTPNVAGKIRGKQVENGVLISFYVEYKDYMKKGDKLSSETALKSIVSIPYEKGMEPYSEYKPEEPIDQIIAPLAISARKTPTLFLSMFGNKIMLGLKEKLVADYFKGE